MENTAINRRSALSLMAKGLIGITAGALLPKKAGAKENPTQLEKRANSPEYCYWYYDNPFSAPNKEKEQTWNTLKTPNDRKLYGLEKFAIDDTDKIPYVKDIWDCTQFSMRTMINFFGFPESQNKDYNNAVYSMFRTSKENNAKFNIPAYFVGINALPDFKHDINTVLIGDNPLNFDDWLFIEPQNDKEVKIGDWNMPKDSLVGVKNIDSFDNTGVSTSKIIKFKLTNGIPSLVDYDKSGLVLTRPTPNAVAEQTPSEFALKQNYPNPFNSSTLIEYNLSKPERVSLEIYNSNGQRLETLVNSNMSAGAHSVRWNPRNYASGIYFCRLRSGNQMQTKKMMIVK